MNHIPFAKNGLPLLICMQLTILIVILCMPLCSTGIIKREIETNETTKLIWEPIKIANNTSVNVTTTTTERTTEATTKKTPAIEISSSSTTPSTTTSKSTPKKLRRTSTTTERRSTTHTTTHATTEKYAEIISKDNVTEASVIDSQPVTNVDNNRDNLDDDAEFITDGHGVTTEEHRFDLSRYTSDYNGNDGNEQSDHNETHQQLTNGNENDDHMPTYNIGYEHNLREMVLTTPESTYFDQKHREYENENESDKGFERYQDDNVVTAKDSEAVDSKFDSDTLLNDIHGNSTEERKQSTYLNQAEVESTNYDVSASEIRDNTANNSTVSGEKKAKFMQEGSHVNLTLPSAGEVWALASMKNVEHSKNQQGQFYNLTSHQKEPDDSKNGTLVTKQLADWVSVTQNNDFTNNSYGANTNTLTSNLSRIREHLAEMIKNINRTGLRTNFNRINNRTNFFNNTVRGRIKYQPMPLITRDQDTASQENQIIAVRLTTLPPPIASKKNYSYTPYPTVSDSQNRIHLQHTDESSPSVTDMVTEMVMTTTTMMEDDDTETTTIQTDNSVDNSQNELKTKFRIKNETVTTNRPTESEYPTTTDRTFQLTTDNEQKTHEMLTTTEAIETTTLWTTSTEPTDDSRTTTTEREFPTTNRVDFETESITEIDEDVDRTTQEQTTVNRPISTENEILESQSSTLIPQYVEIEKTTEMKKPTTTETAPTTTELIEPTTEFIEQRKENKQIESKPEPAADNTHDSTTTIINLNRDEYKYSTFKNRSDDTMPSSPSVDAIPDEVETSSHSPSNGSQVPDIGGYSLDDGPDSNTVIAISISVVGIVVVGAVLAVLFVLRKRKKQLTYGQRCRPVGLDAYSLDNVSVYNSVRRKGMRMSKRSYGNAAFDDPGLKNNLLTGAALVAFAQKKNEIYEEFKELPAVTARAEEVPAGCEDKNRYANIVPLPETRVFLKRVGDDEKTEYINANYVKGPKDKSHYYIACQAPLESTVVDFWRMIWEQNSRVIVMATDLIENGIEQCSEYLPPSFVIDNHVTFGDFHITLKHRDVKDKYAMSMVHLKNMNTNTWREVTHFWYQWPDTGVPAEQSSIIELLLEARGYLKVTTSEQIDDNENSQSNNGNITLGNGSVDKSKSLLRTQGPLTVHCSPGTGRTGTIIACDIVLRALEQPTRSVDIPQIVYFVRRGRASAVRTREQYEFIYKVANWYAAKLTGPATEN